MPKKGMWTPYRYEIYGLDPQHIPVRMKFRQLSLALKAADNLSKVEIHEIEDGKYKRIDYRNKEE